MSISRSQVITCKAAICWGLGEEVKLEEIQVDPPKSNEVRVKMLYASICHSDYLFCRGFPVPLFPRALGHEGVGVVESVGEGVTVVSEGDLVIPMYLGECRECENCMSGKTNMCYKYPLPFTGVLQDGTSRMSIRGQKIYHVFSCSTWSEYTVVDANYVVKIDSRIHLPHASLISCGFTTGFGAAWKEAKVERGSSVAVFGLGAVGLGVIEGARMQGASRIIGVDKNELKRDKGQVMGMTDFINPDDHDQESISEVIKKLTGGIGVDYAFECTGVIPLVNEAFEATKMGIGSLIVIGAGTHLSVPVNMIPLVLGRNIKGTTFGGIKVHSDFPIIVDKCVTKEIVLDDLVTHEVPLEDINKALALMKQPDCVKVVIKI